MKKTATTVCTFIMIIACTSSQVFAKTVDELKKEREQNKTEIQQAQQALDETKTQKNANQLEIDKIDQQLNTVSQDVEVISLNLEKTEELLGQTEIELTAAQETREKQFNAFKQRSRYIYMNGAMSYVDVIFQAKSVSDLLKRVDYVNRIVEYDKGLVDKLKESENTIALMLEETQKQKDDLEVLYVLQIDKQNKYEEVRVQKAALIDELEKDEAMYTVQLDELNASDKEIEKLILAEQEAARLRAAANNQAYNYTYKYDGNPLQWPVPSRSKVSSPYGPRSSPISGRSEFHTGIDIPAPYGSPIVAADAGTIIFSGVKNGYGNTIIIDHGNGMTTLYAHNSSLVAKVGAQVSRGQTIAKCGSTGYSTGNHCHFEVRISGSHTNPRNYVNP